MGEVYQATESVTNRVVAIKVLGERLMNNKVALTRFRQEISAMGHLQHPGIPIFAGYGSLPDGRPYLAMEFVQGRPLDEFVSEQHPLPEDLALWVTEEVVGAMGYCQHESGMIHRDLKPGNVMVDLRGQSTLNDHCHIRVIDFGLALFIDFGDFDDFSVRERRIGAGAGQAGEIVGTPAYMSPEQIRGEQLTFQSDVYAIGCILYYMLTGKRPYAGSSVGVVMAAHLTSPVPDPTQFVQIRPATAAIVQRALAKSAAARYRSYDQFKSAIQAARYAAGQATRRVTRGLASGGGTHQAAPTIIPPPPGAPSSSLGLESPPPLAVSSRWTKPDDALDPHDAPIRPSQLPALPSEALTAQPSTGGWRRPRPTPPPVAPEPLPAEPASDVHRADTSTSKSAASTSNWRRPKPTPLPEPPSTNPPKP